ncbi:hypothetical protein LBMAG53_26620 [Planctomycetota bacterium]|nr:hypothetical protein LBMAG53_26620 [Planctomycetota bacterium]
MLFACLARLGLPVLLLTLVLAGACPPLVAFEEEFPGPQPGWLDVRAAPYHAIGDGVVDDTAALQRALDDATTAGKSVYVYLPAGAYRITSSLRATGKRGLKMIGEHPATTAIRWDGAAGAKMLAFNGCRQVTMARFTVDGRSRGVAGIADDWDGVAGLYAGNWLFCDLVVQDVTEGITAGASDGAAAESMVLRCVFLRNSVHGLKICNFNALNWWLWYCRFEDCATAVLESRGGLHVNRCVFKRSTATDILLNESCNAGIRDNWSLGSRRFCETGAFQTTVFARNVILDTTQEQAIVANGQDVFLDNVVRSAAGKTGPPINIYGRYQPFGNDLTAIGNTATVDPAFVGAYRSRLIDQTTVARTALNPPEPVLPGPAPRVSRAIFRPAIPVTGATIQAAITAAAASADANPIVWIPAGSWPVTQTIVVPANRRLQITGEGTWGITTLSPPSPIAMPVLRFAGPSRASLANLCVYAHQNDLDAEVITVEDADQNGGRVFIQDLTGSDFHDTGLYPNLLVSRLDRTTVECWGCNVANVRVAGGPLAAAGTPGTAVTHLIGSNAGNFMVMDNGDLHVADLYSEIAHQPSLALHGAARFTVEAAQFKRTRRPTGPAIILDAVQGPVSMMAAVFVDNPVEVRGGSADILFNVLASSWTSYPGPWFVDESSAGQATAFHARAELSGGTQAAIPDAGPTDDATLRRLYGAVRSQRSSQLPLLAVPAGATDLRLYRIWLGWGRAGLRIDGPSPDRIPPAAPAAPTVDSATTATPLLTGSTEPLATVAICAGSEPIAWAWADAAGTWSTRLQTPLAAGVHDLRVTAIDRAGNTGSFSPTRRITAASGTPVISAQPGDVSTVAGLRAGFAVAATGSPTPTFAWQRSHDGGRTWSAIAGATTAAYTTPVLTVSDNGARFRCLVANSAGLATSRQARLVVVASGGSVRLFDGLTPTQADVTDNQPYELGLRWRSSQAGVITAIRHWRSPSETGSHIGRLWSASGTQLASVTFTAETASGWQEAALATPVAIAADTTYVVSVNINSRYPCTVGGLAESVLRPPLSTIVGGNGVFGSVGTFPTQSWNNSNYFRDVVFRSNSPTRIIRMSTGGAITDWTITPTAGRTIPGSGAVEFADLTPTHAYRLSPQPALNTRN